MNQNSLIMKTSFFFIQFLFCALFCFAQDSNHNADGSGKVLVNNDKVEVIEYVGKVHDNVCGIGEHNHEAHLTVALTDAKVLITSPYGKQQTAEIPAGAAMWFDKGTHSAVNGGDKETKFLLIYLKE